MVKNPNRLEVNQLSGRDWNLGPPDYKSRALKERPRCLLHHILYCAFLNSAET